MPRVERVFVDTATLYPISLADLALRLAEFGMYDLVWSDHLLIEVERVLVEHKGLTPDPLLLRMHPHGLPRWANRAGGIPSARSDSDWTGPR